uniref:DNA-binding domain-containing protein n=1 Tax=Candidatus Kentrum sp. SD TaxID=2126332 RepID=A0A451BLF6_9GAMM|nr:MAG: Putative DNA-binding domain-containing protein [Candidatus Kentron sp. SD]
MDIMDLLKTETDRIEWKETEKDTKDIARAVCALANDLGDTREDGYLILGVRKDGTPLGVKGDQLGRSVEGIWRPNPAALLIFGIDPQSFFPGAILEFVRYEGSDIDSAIVSRKTITGTLADQLDSVWTQLEANLVERPARDNGIRLEFLANYPIGALKELARNMTQHRLFEGTNAPGRIEWYNDRIEFSNPGGPFGHANEGEFGETSDYRNPNITGKLAEKGYVQRLGRGVRRVRQRLAKNGNPPLEVETDGYTRVIVRSAV